jgi:hypothetical protein
LPSTPQFLQDGLFAAGDDVFFAQAVDGCETTPLRLWRFDGDAWTAVGDGLPSRGDADCASPNIWDRNLWVTSWSDAGGVLFADVEHGGTWRSSDRGATWSPVENMTITSAAACGGAIVGLTRDGDLVRSEDGGASFTAMAPIAGARALATVGDACVLGLLAYDGDATLMTSTDGLSFSAIDFTEPVLALAADDTTVAISTASHGVFRVDVDPTGSR